MFLTDAEGGSQGVSHLMHLTLQPRGFFSPDQFSLYEEL